MRHIPIPREDMHPHSRSPFPERMCIPGEDKSQWNKHPHWKWGCASPGMHILSENGVVPHGECTSSPGMGLCLTGNAHPHREWGCHRECISSPGMHIVYRRCCWGNLKHLALVMLCYHWICHHLQIICSNEIS